MQALSSMRRNSSYKESLKALALLALIVSYGALTDILYYLPPLLGVAFVLFCRFLERGQPHYIVPIFVFLLFFEATKGFLWLSSIIFFVLSYYLVALKVRQWVRCQKCLIPFLVLYAYFGFYLFAGALGYLLGVSVPDISVILFYFSLAEILFLVVLP